MKSQWKRCISISLGLAIPISLMDDRRRWNSMGLGASVTTDLTDRFSAFKDLSLNFGHGGKSTFFNHCSCD